MTKQERDRAYYLANRERILKRVKRYAQRHRKERLAYLKQWRAAHPRSSTEWRDKNPERKRELDRKWDRRHRAKREEYERSRRDPLKSGSRKRLRCAVQKGEIKKPSTCSKCRRRTEKRQLHGHHTDHRRPLDVTWLCSGCHGKEHRTPVHT